MDHIYRLYGLPKSIVTDMDPIFLSKFWRKLFKLQGINLLYFLAYLLQMDGQTKVVNQWLEQYLRCMSGINPSIGWNGYLLRNGGITPASTPLLKLVPSYKEIYGKGPLCICLIKLGVWSLTCWTRACWLENLYWNLSKRT